MDNIIIYENNTLQPYLSLYKRLQGSSKPIVIGGAVETTTVTFKGDIKGFGWPSSYIPYTPRLLNITAQVVCRSLVIFVKKPPGEFQTGSLPHHVTKIYTAFPKKA